jgi:hypothetical protein
MNTLENLTVHPLRLPRLAIAALLLGAVACGGDDDTQDTDNGDATAEMAEVTSDAGKTAAPSSPGADAGANSADGGTANADAAAASAADAATDAAPIDVSEARVAKVLQDFCTAEFTCDPEDAVDAYTDLDTCVFEQRTYIDDDLVTSGAACASAELDFNTCYAAAGCDTDPELVCEVVFFRMLTVCD